MEEEINKLKKSGENIIKHEILLGINNWYKSTHFLYESLMNAHTKI